MVVLALRTIGPRNCPTIPFDNDLANELQHPAAAFEAYGLPIDHVVKSNLILLATPCQPHALSHSADLGDAVVVAHAGRYIRARKGQ